jgi:alkylation response protein AidB-like acyl-CoA dehydrogenase
LTEDQERFQLAVRKFVHNAVAPHAAEWEESRGFPRDLLREIGRMGFLSVTVPPEWGGVGADYVSCALTLMEIGAGDGALAVLVSAHNSVLCMPLVTYGTDAQRERYVRKVTTGEMLGAFALTEPHGGSDASDLRTTAVRYGKGWRIDGVKQFISSASIADFVLVFAKTDPAAGKRGVSAFVFPTSTPGYRVTRVEKKMGLNATDTCEVLFDGVEVGDDALVGEVGQGYKIALSNLEGGRIGVAAQCVGIARSALEHAVAYAKERVTFGKPIAQHQAVAVRLGDMATRVTAAEQLVLHAAALKDAGRPCHVEASMAKLLASEVAERVASDAVQTLGGNGYMAGYPVERIYRSARAPKLYEGTNDIQKLLISRALTGMSAL